MLLCMLHKPLRLPPPALNDGDALFLDVDGTLLAFAAHPDEVKLLPHVRDTLGRLQGRLHGAVALVSGRPLHQLDQLFAPLLLPAAGVHGLEIRTSGRPSTTAPAPHSQLDGLRERSRQLAQQHAGVLVEDKGAAVALHWRRTPTSATPVTDFAHAELTRLKGYRLQAGDHVIEFLPEHSDKGSAVAVLMQFPLFNGRRPVFVGDDLTDEFGFAAATQLGGWGVLVGAREGSKARYALPDITGVHAWLEASSR